MKFKLTPTDNDALVIGALAGSRSALAWSALQRRTSTSTDVSDVLAATEIVGEKLPLVPARIKKLPLVLRMAVGGYTAYELAKLKGHANYRYALLGAAAALTSSFVLYGVREGLHGAFKTSRLVMGIAEDVAAVKLSGMIADGQTPDITRALEAACSK